MKTIKIIDLINLYRLSDMTRIEIRRNNWFVLEAEKENIPNYIKNKEVLDFVVCDDKLVVNYAEGEVQILDEEDEFEDIESFDVHYSWDYIDYKNIEELKKYVSKDLQNIFNTLDKLIKNQKKIIERLKNENSKNNV